MTDEQLAKIKEAAEKLRRKVFFGPTMEAAHTKTTEWIAADYLDGIIARLEAAEDRIKTLEKMDYEAGTYVESVICMRSSHFTGDVPYVGWKGLGLALEQDYDALKTAEARASTAYAEGIEAAAKTCMNAAILETVKRNETPPDSEDWQVRNHAAFMLASAYDAIRALLKDKPNG